jgi:hypothetical protein
MHATPTTLQCCAISPGAPLLATGLISGHLVLHTYAFGEPPAADSIKKGPNKGKPGQPESTVKKGGPVLSAVLAREVEAHPGEHSCRCVRRSSSNTHAHTHTHTHSHLPCRALTFVGSAS